MKQAPQVTAGSPQAGSAQRLGRRGVWQAAWMHLREERRAYVGMNALYYGMILVGLVLAAMRPGLQQGLMGEVGRELTSGGLAPIARVYSGGNAWLAALLTFLVNLSLGSLLTITLPSLLLPWSGIAVGCLRAVLWGLLFAPTRGPSGVGELAAAVLVGLVLLLEGQGYVLAMFAAYQQGRAFLRPDTVGASSRRQGYAAGLKSTAKIYLLVALVLAIAALVEAVAGVVLIPRLV